MTLNNSKLAEIIGFVAIIASLLFVAYEIRQANRIAVGTTAYEIQRNWMAINDLIVTDDNLNKLIIKMFDDDTELSREERVRVDAYVRRFINTWVAIDEAHRNGLVSDVVRGIAADEIQRFSGFRNIRESFNRFESTYDVSEIEILDPLRKEYEK